jgi:hypothetical protein
VKGKVQPVDIYELMGAGDTTGRECSSAYCRAAAVNSSVPSCLLPGLSKLAFLRSCVLAFLRRAFLRRALLSGPEFATGLAKSLRLAVASIAHLTHNETQNRIVCLDDTRPEADTCYSGVVSRTISRPKRTWELHG